MIFPALGALAAVWLVVSPFLGLEVGARAIVAVMIGIATLLVAPLGVWFRPARWAMALLGLVLAFVNFAAFAPIGGLADLGTCAVLIILGGIAPEPVLAAAAQVSATATGTVSPIVRPDVRAPAASVAGPAAKAHAA